MHFYFHFRTSWTLILQAEEERDHSTCFCADQILVQIKRQQQGCAVGNIRMWEVCPSESHHMQMHYAQAHFTTYTVCCHSDNILHAGRWILQGNRAFWHFAHITIGWLHSRQVHVLKWPSCLQSRSVPLRMKNTIKTLVEPLKSSDTSWITLKKKKGFFKLKQFVSFRYPHSVVEGLKRSGNTVCSNMNTFHIYFLIVPVS